jgi:ankyrin repeat protein
MYDILIEMCKSGNIDDVKYLIENNVDINVILSYSIEHKRIDIFKYVIENGADKDIALRLSVVNKHLDNIEYLHENGVDVHSNNRNALRIIVENFCSCISNNSFYNYGNTNNVLRYANENSYYNIIIYLLTRGNDIAAIHANVVAAVCFGTKAGHPAIIKRLIEEIADNYSN